MRIVSLADSFFKEEMSGTKIGNFVETAKSLYPIFLFFNSSLECGHSSKTF